ncbi:MAG: hypothetical protein A2Y25_09295 [Candidatus Melainabacteria bacterium GWF2_37_15]|nr:MAG: hypothetical protein A2Y25_09295 [Candidatus Melainabacteria bacterium GWF2_37_15]
MLNKMNSGMKRTPAFSAVAVYAKFTGPPAEYKPGSKDTFEALHQRLKDAAQAKGLVVSEETKTDGVLMGGFKQWFEFAVKPNSLDPKENATLMALDEEKRIADIIKKECGEFVDVETDIFKQRPIAAAKEIEKLI